MVGSLDQTRSCAHHQLKIKHFYGGTCSNKKRPLHSGNVRLLRLPQKLRQLGDVRRYPPRNAHRKSGLLLLRFWAGNGRRLWAGSARRRPNAGPGIVRLLIGNLAGRRFVIVVELLPAFLFLRREWTFLISLQRHTWHRHLCESACRKQGQRPSERYKSAPPGLRQSPSHCAYPLHLSPAVTRRVQRSKSGSFAIFKQSFAPHPGMQPQKGIWAAPSKCRASTA